MEELYNIAQLRNGLAKMKISKMLKEFSLKELKPILKLN